MQTVVGPVVVTKEGGFGFDLWTSGEGLSRGFSYRRIEDAYYARKAEMRSRSKGPVAPMMACGTLDEFASALAELSIPCEHPFTLTPRPTRPRRELDQ